MRAKWRSSLSACSSALEKCLTRTDIVRDAMFRQQWRKLKTHKFTSWNRRFWVDV
jgi:hypothetical protein